MSEFKRMIEKGLSEELISSIDEFEAEDHKVIRSNPGPGESLPKAGLVENSKGDFITCLI